MSQEQRPRLSPAEVQLVLRRAAELEQRGEPSDALSAAEVESLGAEVGLAPETVRRALTELNAGALTVPARPGAIERLLGPHQLVIEREVQGRVVEVRARVERYLRGQLLRVRRDYGAHATWEPSPGWLHEVRRKLDFTGRVGLRDLRELDVAVIEGAQPERTRVRFVVDVRPQQRRMLFGAGASLAAAGGLAFVLHAMGTPPVFEALAAVGTAGGGTLGGWRLYRRHVENTATALERFLDELEHQRPPSPRGALDQLLGLES